MEINFHSSLSRPDSKTLFSAFLRGRFSLPLSVAVSSPTTVRWGEVQAREAMSGNFGESIPIWASGSARNVVTARVAVYDFEKRPQAAVLELF